MFDRATKIELKKGNPAAFKEVFRLLYPRLKGYCALFLEDDSEAEDIIQECFIVLWEKHESINIEKRLESLLFVMVRNRCFNYLKSKKLTANHFDVEGLNVNELQYLYQLDLNNREEKSLEEMLLETLQQAVNDLPPKMKSAFVKSKLEGKKQAEVAKELGISIKMVEKHIAKAKERIRVQLLKKYSLLIVLIAVLSGLGMIYGFL